MTLQEFLTFFTGIFCDYDGAYGDQCFDLANAYSRWIGGQRFTGDTADLIYNQPGDFYEQVKNGATNFPVKGDIVLWNWPHVGIATGNNTDGNQFEVLEQNDPENSNCHIKVYSNYNGVIGWLHPKNLPQELSAIVDDLRKARDDNYNFWQAEVTKNGELVRENQGLKVQISQVNQADATLLEQYKKKLEEDSTAIDAGLKAEKTLQNIADLLKVVVDEKTILEAISALQIPHEEAIKPVLKERNTLYNLIFKDGLGIYKRSPKAKSLIQQIKGIFKWK